MNKIKFFLMTSLFISFFFINIATTNSIEPALEDASFARAISVAYTQEELNKIENSEITNPRKPYSLGFMSESFTPTGKLGEMLQAKVEESVAPSYVGENYTYGFIMIIGRITQGKLQNISNYGVKLLGYHSGHSYKAKIPLNKVNEIKELPFIKWVGYATLKQKLHPNLFDRLN